jgi:hypothetical protein
MSQPQYGKALEEGQQAPWRVASRVLEARRVTGGSLASRQAACRASKRGARQAHGGSWAGWSPCAVMAARWNPATCSMHVRRYPAPPGGRHNSLAGAGLDGTAGFSALVPSGSSLAGSRVPGRGELSASLMGRLVASAIPASKASSRLASPWSAPAQIPNLRAVQAAVASIAASSTPRCKGLHVARRAFLHPGPAPSTNDPDPFPRLRPCPRRLKRCRIALHSSPPPSAPHPSLPAHHVPAMSSFFSRIKSGAVSRVPALANAAY